MRVEEIIADLRRPVGQSLVATRILHREAADELTRLRGENDAVKAERDHLQTALNETLAELFTPPSTAVVRGDTIYVNEAADLMARLTDVYRYLREQKRGLDALTVIGARGAIEVCDLDHGALSAQLDAVKAALDQHDAEHYPDLRWAGSASRCVSAIAKVFGR